MLSFWPGMSFRPMLAAALAGLAAVGACGRDSPQSATSVRHARPEVPPLERATTPRVVFLGDSLTAGYGLDASEAYPSIVQRRLTAAGLDVEVVNAGVSGDTSAGGLRRVDWALDGHVVVLVVALGGNDALRGLSVEELRRNLGGIIDRARQKNVAVILAGMEAPPNLGGAYTSAFRQVYRDLAASYHVAFVPFLLEGVAGRPALNQADGIHPNAEGALRVADLVLPYVERAVRAAGKHD